MALTLMAAAQPADPAAAASAPLVGVEVAPAGRASLPASAVVTDDMVYAIVGQDDRTGSSHIFSRPLATQDGGTTVGERSFVARASGVVMAEHEGAIAYLRHPDRHLVLRSADGREHVPAWGADQTLASWGPQAMNGSWIASMRMLFNHKTGAQVDLSQLSGALLPGATWVTVPSVALAEDQVVWTVRATIPSNRGGWVESTHVHLASLSDTTVGEVRTVRSLPEVTIGSWRITDVWYAAGHIVSVDSQPTGAHWRELTAEVVDRPALAEVSRYPVGSAGYDDAPQRQTGLDLFTTGNHLAIATTRSLEGRPLPTTVQHDDLDVPGLDGTEVQLEAGASVEDVHGGLVAYKGVDGVIRLVDVSGGRVTLDPSPLPAGPFVVQTPRRLVDDRTVPPLTPRCVRVTGSAGGVGMPEGATGAIINVTSVRPSGVGHVVVYPDSSGSGATPLPSTGSTVNFEPGRDVANGTFVALPPNGTVCYGTRGAANAGVIIDITGYTLAGSGVTMRSPQRILDTRANGSPLASPVRARTVHTVDVAGAAQLPRSASAVLLNVTVTGATAPGHLRVFPAGTPLPNASTVNYAPGRDKANGTIVALSPDGKVALYSDTSPASPIQVVLDVVGYVEAGSFTGITPRRLMDTRTASHIGDVVGPVAPHDVISVKVAGRSGVPEDAIGVVLNVTAAGPTVNGNLRVYPDTAGTRRTAPPVTSSVNYIPARDIPNLVIVALPPNGHVNFWSDQSSGSVQLIADVVGYITD
jgi:hypothetical protein